MEAGVREEDAARGGARDVEARRVTGYHRFLFAMVAVATLFEGFDQTILGLAAPYVAADFGLSPRGLGLLLTVVTSGAIAAMLVTVLADRHGRRNLLMATVAGYALFTGLTAFSRGLADFVVWQFLARVFLMAEVMLAMVIVAEEFPARRRGFALGLVITMNLAGATLCSLVLPAMMRTASGWRSLYLLGLAPLALVFALRFGLRETRRFDAARAGGAARPSALEVWRPPHRGPLVRCILLFGAIGVLTNAFTAFYPYFLVRERGFTPEQVSATYALAMLAGIAGVPLGGWLMDRWGRRALGVAGPLLAAGGLWAAFTATGGHARITLAGALGVFAGCLALPVQYTYATELFPTRLRAITSAWVGNGLGRAIAVASPALIGALIPRLGSVGAAASALWVVGLAASALVFTGLPETRGRTLEETSGEEPGPAR